MRIWLDPDKLAALNMTAADVVSALREQNRQVAAGQIGQQPIGRRPAVRVHRSRTLGRLTDAGAVRGHRPPHRRRTAAWSASRTSASVELGATNLDIDQQGRRPAERQPGHLRSCPTPTPSPPPSASATKMEELKKSFPEDVDYDDLATT